MATQAVRQAPGDDVVPQGPFGGPGGDPFYDGVGDIVQITVTYSSEVVWSLQTLYRQTAANSFTTQQHGSTGPQTAVIKLDFPNERLLQVKGTISPAGGVDYDVVTSVTFVTDKKSYGPYGPVKGRLFQSSPLGKVVGFFGRSGVYVDDIGTFTDFSNSDSNLVVDGPWGGNGGDVFYDGRADKIKQIDVVYLDAIISLNVKYDQGTKGFFSSMHGGANGTPGKSTSILFEEDEYLAQVTGTYGEAYDLTLVTSLSFVSNKKVYGPFGVPSGTPFKSRPGSQIQGFYGKAGWLLDQIGVFAATTAPPRSVVVSGGFGGNGGSPWYDGRGEISSITVKYKPDDVIGQIQVTYLQGGQQFVAPLHGENPLTATATISLNFPEEYLLQVKGTHGTAEGVNDLILSLQFITNKKTYGPYGNSSKGTPFATSHVGRIVGLFGRSGVLLDQISAINVAPPLELL